MGKGTVTANLTLGQYNVDYLYDLTLRDAKIVALDGGIDQLSENKSQLTIAKL